MYRILLVLLLLVSSFVIAQQTPGEKTIEAYNFGTLETKSGPFNAKQGGATTYHNLDPSRKLGSLNKRWGYSAVDELNDGFDSLTGIYSAYLSDGRQFLVYAADSAGVGYGGLYITGSGDDSISNASRFWKYWSPAAPTTFAMFDDKLYAMNGVQAGAVYNFDTRKAIRFPIQAPGEMLVTPITAANGVLDGEYRYSVRVGFIGDSSNTRKVQGVITQPVRVSDGHVLLTGFQVPNVDAGNSVKDSVWIYIYRTTANPGRLEQTDTLWSVYFAQVDTTTLKTFVAIDSVNDSLARLGGSHNAWSSYTYAHGLDSFRVVGNSRYGAPGYVSYDTTILNDTLTNGVFNGITRLYLPLAVSYVCTFYDTLNNVESDTGRSLFVYDDTAASIPKRIRLSLPRLPDSATHIVKNLYRANLQIVGRDTSFNVTNSVFNPSALPSSSEMRKWVKRENQRLGWEAYYVEEKTEGFANVRLRALTRDTVIVTPYHLVEQVSSDSIYYTDSTRYDTLLTHEMYKKTPPSTRLNRPFTYNGSLFGIDGSNLKWSYIDSASRWGAFDDIAVSRDDGQRITLAYPTRRSIRVFKDKSSYNVYQDGGGNWNLTEVTNGIGCIAPNSHAVSPAGHYYLSQDGVILENEGDYLERTYKTGLISANLDNFDKLPMSAKSKAVGTYFNHKYFLTVPIAGAADTTYVWDELAQGWATWSMPIGGSAVYDTESVAGYAPGNSMYFYYPNGKELYKYGNSLTDAGAYIWSNWTSTPFLTDEYEEAVSAIGVWFDDISSGDFIRFYDIVDGRDTVRSNLALFTDLGDTVGYREEAVASLRTGAYHQLAMWSTPDASGTWSRIDKINVSYLPLGKRTRFGETTAFVGGESGEGGAGTITFGDITGVIAGYGLSGGGLSGDVTLTVDTSVIAELSDIIAANDSVMYADSSGYADTAGVALNGGSTDSFYVAQSDTTVIGWKQSGDTIFIDTTGGVGGGMSMDSTTAGDGLLETANDIDVVPGFGILIRNDSVHADFTELDDTLPRYARIRDTVTTMLSTYATKANIHDSLLADTNVFLTSFNRLKDTAAAVRVDIRDTVNVMGITDSTVAGTALTETGNTINVITKWGLRSGADSVMASVTDLDDSLTLLTDFAKITDDSANWNTVYTDYNTGGWETGDIANGTLEPIDLNHSSKWKIDAFYGDTAVADSHYTTIARLNKIADDTTNFKRAYDSVDAWEAAFDPDYLTGDATDNNLVDSAIVQGVSPAKIGAGGALAGEVLTYSGSVWEPQPSGSFTNLQIHGDLLSFGSPRVVNHAERVDIQNMWASHKTSPLYIELPDTVYFGAGNESLTVVHPSIIYIPGGWPAAKPYKYWMAMTYGNDAYEDGFLRVSNDGETWTRFFIGNDSCPDPIAAEDNTQYGKNGVPHHLSDNELIMGADAKLHFYIRATDTANNAVYDTTYNAIFHTESSDGLTWSTPVKIIDWKPNNGEGGNQLMSPAIWVDTNATYKAWTIHYKDSSFSSMSHKFSTITLWQSDSANGTFDSVQQVTDSTTGSIWFRDTTKVGDRFGGLGRDGKKDSAVVWHIDAIESGGDEKFALITASAPKGTSSYYLLGGVSRDGGKSLVIRREPIIADSAHDLSFGASAIHATTWDYSQIYKSTGYWVNTGNGGYIDLFYNAVGPNSYRIGRTRLEFLRSASMPRVQVSGRQNAPTDSLVLTFGGFVDSTTGVADLFVDSSGYGGVGVKNDYVYATFKADNDFALDSLIFRWMHTEAGTGSAAGTERDSVRTDSLILYGPDLSSGTNACDSVWWVKGGPDSINVGFPVHDSTLPGWTLETRTRTAIPLRLYQLAPAGSIFRLVMINRFNAARSAVHVEDIEIKGRSR